MSEFYHQGSRQPRCSPDRRSLGGSRPAPGIHRRGLALTLLLLAPACTTQLQSEPSSSTTSQMGALGATVAPGDADDVVDLVESFLQLRITGDGAEAFLSSAGLEAYGLEGDPDGRELSGLLYEKKGDSYTAAEIVTVESIEGPDGVSTFEWEVLVQLVTVGSDESHLETIFVSRSDNGRLLMDGGRTGWEGP